MAQALSGLLSGAYRRFLADFLPGFLLLVTLWFAGWLHALADRTPSSPTEGEAVLLAVVSFPLSLIMGFLAWAFFYNFCWSTQALYFPAALVGSERTEKTHNKEQYSLVQLLLLRGGATASALQDTIPFASRNVLRSHGKTGMTEYIDRLDGVAVFLRTTALAIMIYLAVALLTVWVVRTIAIAGLLVSLPVGSVVSGKLTEGLTRGGWQWVQRHLQWLWLGFLFLWGFTLFYVALPLGWEVVLVPPFSILMLVLHKQTVLQSETELFRVVRGDDLLKHLVEWYRW